MLKIKDDVDLKELEKFGFEPRYSETTGKVVRYVKGDNRNIITYIDNNHNHKPYWELNIRTDLLLYDLIQARTSRKSINI